MAAMGVTEYQSSQYGCHLIDGFQRLWQNDLLCDTTLIVQDISFHLHRCLLAACSNYFFSMFSKNFTESNKKDIELKGVTVQGLRAILNYAYSGKVVIEISSLQDILEAASHLQFTEVLYFCAKYLKENLKVENCLQFLKLTEMYMLKECKKAVKGFILENFVPVASADDFKNISLELLCEFLSDDRLRAHCELDVFKVAMKWLERHPERQAVAKEVLELVRYGLMSVEEMEIVYSSPIMLSESCREVLQVALSYHLKLFSQPVMRTTIKDIRAYKEYLVVLGGGYTDNTLDTDFQAAELDPVGTEVGSFQNLGPGKIERYFAAVAVVDEFVYIAGGQTAMAGDGSHATDNVYCYNPRNNKWLQICSMNFPRTHYPLVALGNNLLAVGGKDHRIALDSAERYDFKTNQWFQIAPLPTTLFSHAGCCYDNRLYVSGGCPGEDFTDAVLCYDPDLDEWQMKAPLNQSRGYHVMVTHSNKLFVCAGNTHADDRRDVLMTEVYDVELDQWTVLTPCLQGQSEAPVVKHGNKIFILGGYTWNAHSFQSSIQCYDLENDTWKVLDTQLPEPMTGAVACKLKMPYFLFDGHSAESVPLDLSTH